MLLKILLLCPRGVKPLSQTHAVKYREALFAAWPTGQKSFENAMVLETQVAYLAKIKVATSVQSFYYLASTWLSESCVVALENIETRRNVFREDETQFSTD